MPPTPRLSLSGFSLKQRMLSSGMWSLAAYAFNIVFRFASNLFMTRMLAPELFGIVAMAMTVMVGLTMVTDLGLKVNVIRSTRGNDPTFLNTVWTTQILRGVILWLVALLASLLFYLRRSKRPSPADTVYTDPSLPPVVAVLSFVVVIYGFHSTKSYEESRNLSFQSHHAH